MMAQSVPHQTTSTAKKRVKVYELRNNDWYDRGTGFCSAAFLQTDKEGQAGDPRVYVESEENPERLLLETKISKEDGFQKQQDTLIVWTDPSSGVDMALSFQEAEGCNLIWKFISGIQQVFHGGIAAPGTASSYYDVDQADMAEADDMSDDLNNEINMDVPSTVTLPATDLSCLPELENTIRMMVQTANGRDALAKFIMREDYIGKLIPLVEMAEDLESLADLHRLCNIMKTIILINDTGIIEHAVSDDYILGVVGALEYDPDFPSHKANHRHWLGNELRFKEVVPIEDEHILRKIHQTYRLQYLKDVVLARILDDATFSILNSLIFFNQVDVVQHLQGNASFLNELFGIFRNAQPDQKKKKDAVLFISQCCAIAKNLQPPGRQTLYNNLIAHGLLQVINFGLRHADVAVRVGATDILVSMIDHDPHMIRQTLYRQVQEEKKKMAELKKQQAQREQGSSTDSEQQKPDTLERSNVLTDSLVDLLLVEADLGVQSQTSDALKVLLDQGAPVQAQEAFLKSNGEIPGRTRPQTTQMSNHDELLAWFYDQSAPKLFRPLMTLEGRTDMGFSVQQASMFTYLVELLTFFCRQHIHSRVRFFISETNIVPRVVQLLGCRDKYLRLVALRFFRQLIASQDEFYVRHVKEKNVLGPILDVLTEALPRDNLLCSSCLEIFELIRKDDRKDGRRDQLDALADHLKENYREQLVRLSYFDTFEDILNPKPTPKEQEATADESSGMTDESARRPLYSNTRLGEQITLDPSEEEYWNADDDEEIFDARPDDDEAVNGSATPNSKPLVDYASDDEADENQENAVPRQASEDKPMAEADAEQATQAPVAPPERLSEKRRRDEDEDEDELGKLMQNKRRNSSSAGSNASIASSGGAKRRKSLSDRSSPSNAPRKISISLSPSVKTGGMSSSDDES